MLGSISEYQVECRERAFFGTSCEYRLHPCDSRCLRVEMRLWYRKEQRTPLCTRVGLIQNRGRVPALAVTTWFLLSPVYKKLMTSSQSFLRTCYTIQSPLV